MVCCFAFSTPGVQPKCQNLNPNFFKVPVFEDSFCFCLMNKFVNGHYDYPAITFLLTLGFNPLIPTLSSLLSGWAALFQRHVWSNLGRDGYFKAKTQSWRLDPNITILLVLDCSHLYILGFPALLFGKLSHDWTGSANSPSIQTPCLIYSMLHKWFPLLTPFCGSWCSCRPGFPGTLGLLRVCPDFLIMGHVDTFVCIIWQSSQVLDTQQRLSNLLAVLTGLGCRWEIQQSFWGSRVIWRPSKPIGLVRMVLVFMYISFCSTAKDFSLQTGLRSKLRGSS